MDHAVYIFSYFILIIPTKHASAIKCVQCLSDIDANCINNPPDPLPCNGTDMKYCIVLEVQSVDGQLLRLTRTCSPDDIIDEECEDGIGEDGAVVIVCHRACPKDGCNSASSVHCTCINLLVMVMTVLYFVRKHD